MITPRYEYVKLSKKEDETGKRKYATPDGNKLPSVTTILEITKPEEEKQSLQDWRNAIGHKQAQAITTEAANRGTRMHSYLEYYVENGAMKQIGTNPYARVSHLMAQEVVKHGMPKVNEVWGSEVSLYFPNVYAGTTDLVGVHDKTEAIMDFKQANKPKKKEWITGYFLQAVFYGTAHNELYGTNIQKGVVMMCVRPKTDANLNIIEPPQYLEFIVEGEEWKRYEQLMWQRLEQYYTHHYKG